MKTAQKESSLNGQIVRIFADMSPKEVNDLIASRIMGFYAPADLLAANLYGGAEMLRIFGGRMAFEHTVTRYEGLYCATSGSSPVKFDPYHDLNDCFLFEEALKNRDKIDPDGNTMLIYHANLLLVVSGDKADSNTPFNAYHASAKQRCKAAIGLIGKGDLEPMPIEKLHGWKLLDEFLQKLNEMNMFKGTFFMTNGCVGYTPGEKVK